MFRAYNNFEYHEHSFNTIFATSIVVAVSLLIGGSLASVGFFNNSNTWFVFLILVAVPIIVFIALSGESEFKTAYYKTWRDRIAGRFDQRKILRQFARQYKIKNWKTKLEKIEADGRWNFHADTNYMRGLAEQRDLLLSQIHQEYLNKLNDQNKIIIEARRVLANANVELDMAKKKENNAKTLLDAAKSSGEVYKQRQNYDDKMREANVLEEVRNDAEHRLKALEQDKDNLHDNYQDIIYRVAKIYYARYSKYTEHAIRKINRVNGLKYTIADMPEAESWVSNPARKEL